MLYRDLKSKSNVDDLFDNGRLMVSSLYRFRNLEDLERKDVSEGKKHVSTTINPVSNKKPIRVPIRQLNADGEELSDVAYFRFVEIANCFALSFTIKPSASDSTIKITNPLLFSQIVAKEIEDKGYDLGCFIQGPCEYYECGRSDEHVFEVDNRFYAETHKNPILTAFLKEKKKYQDDHEYRMVWVPTYGGKAAVKTQEVFTKYGYKQDLRDSCWPPQMKDFPNADEMIGESIFIQNDKLRECLERCVSRDT